MRLETILNHIRNGSTVDIKVYGLIYRLHNDGGLQVQVYDNRTAPKRGAHLQSGRKCFVKLAEIIQACDKACERVNKNGTVTLAVDIGVVQCKNS